MARVAVDAVSWPDENSRVHVKGQSLVSSFTVGTTTDPVVPVNQFSLVEAVDNELELKVIWVTGMQVGTISMVSENMADTSESGSVTKTVNSDKPAVRPAEIRTVEEVTVVDVPLGLVRLRKVSVI